MVDIALSITGQQIIQNDTDRRTNIGDVVEYTYKLTNRSANELTELTLDDIKGTLIEEFSGVIGAGATVLLRSRYTLQREDLDAGRVGNRASVRQNGVLKSNILDDSFPLTQSFGLSVVNTFIAYNDANGNGRQDVNETFTYESKVSNTGTTSLFNLQLFDDNGTPGNTADDTPIDIITSPPSGLMDLDSDGVADDLPAGASFTVISTGRLNQASIDDGQTNNGALVTAIQVNKKQLDATSPAGSTIVQSPAINLVKTAGEIQDTNGDRVNSVGDEVTYTYRVTNTGNVTLKNIVLTDDNGTPNDTNDDRTISLRDASSNVITTLAPGQAATGTFTGQLTQAAIESGQLTNIAVVTGQSPQGSNVTDDDTATVKPIAQPAIELVKRAGAIQDTNGDSVNSVGDEVTYTYRVTNTGNVTLKNIVLTDDNGTPNDTNDDRTISLRDASSNVITTLAPGQAATGTFTGQLTQAAIESGQLTNIAVVTGQSPQGSNVTDDDTATVKPIAQPAIDLVKTADKRELRAGEVVTYTYTARNTGNVNLFNVSLFDDNGTPNIETDDDDFQINFTTGLTDLDGDSQIDDLAIGASATATYKKTITADDLLTASFTNVGKVMGVDRTGRSVQATDPETITFLKTPSIALRKDGELDLGHDCVLTPGDIITYTFTITNTGEVTLNKLELIDTLPGLSAFQFSGPTSLVPGQETTATATYAVTEANICDGFVVNVATVYGNPIGGNLDSPTDDVTAIDRKTINLNALSGGGGNDVLNGGSGNGNLGGGSGNDLLDSASGNSGLNNTFNANIPGYSAVGNIIYGTNSDDRITPPDNQNYTVYANEGHNTIVTKDGADSLYGGSGVDVIVTGNGDKTIYANEGKNSIITGSGNDRIFGGSSDDWIFTGAGDDLIYAGEGNNYVAAGTGNNQVYLGSGADYAVLFAGEGSTTIYNFNAAIDKLGLAGLAASDISVTKVSVDGYFTRISAGDDILAELNGVHLDKSQLQFERLDSAGSTSVSFLRDPFRSILQDQLLAAGAPTTTVNSLFP